MEKKEKDTFLVFADWLPACAESEGHVEVKV